MVVAALILSGCMAAPVPMVTGQRIAVVQTDEAMVPRGQGSGPAGVIISGSGAGADAAERGFGGALPRARSAESSGSGAELAFVSGILRELQQRSFAANTEFCGYIGLDPAGALIATPPRQGTEATCTLPQVPAGMTLLASFHTHGTYSPYYASEFPTTTDMLSDASDDIDGYISTPGGRLWYVDSDTMTARQLCGRGCLPQDPGYDPSDDGPLLPVFTLQQLRQWEAG